MAPRRSGSCELGSLYLECPLRSDHCGNSYPVPHRWHFHGLTPSHGYLHSNKNVPCHSKGGVSGQEHVRAQQSEGLGYTNLQAGH